MLEVTTPVYREAPLGRPPELIGSAVLMELGGERIVLTAAHVLDDATSDSALYIGTPNALELLQGRRIGTPSGASGRRDDRVDVGAVRLPASVAGRFPPSCFLSVHEVAPWGAPGEGGAVAVGGYPKTKERRLSTLKREAGFHALLAMCVGPEVYDRLKVKPSHALAMGFSKRGIWQLPLGAENARRGVSPDLVGLSGGGVWVLRRPSGTKDLTPVLCGIGIEWRRQQKMIVATRIEVLLGGIWKYWPDLRASLPPEIVGAPNAHRQSDQG
jgi:hypothetical protein